MVNTSRIVAAVAVILLLLLLENLSSILVSVYKSHPKDTIMIYYLVPWIPVGKGTMAVTLPLLSNIVNTYALHLIVQGCHLDYSPLESYNPHWC